MFLTIHSFRAGFATQLYQSSKDIVIVARAMGHKHIKTTNQYIADDMALIHEAVEEAFGYLSIMH
jgi:integrase